MSSPARSPSRRLRGPNETARPDRLRTACSVHRRLAVEQGRLRQFAGVRSHVRGSVHREALRGLRAKHYPVVGAIAGDLTSVFNFANPNDAPVPLLDTDPFLPSKGELNGADLPTFVPGPGDVIIGVPPP